MSSRLAAFPAWVLDYVLVHELAHLLVAHHGPEHDELVDRYPYAERARGFLIAKDLDPDSETPRHAERRRREHRPVNTRVELSTAASWPLAHDVRP